MLANSNLDSYFLDQARSQGIRSDQFIRILVRTVDSILPPFSTKQICAHVLNSHTIHPLNLLQVSECPSLRGYRAYIV